MSTAHRNDFRNIKCNKCQNKVLFWYNEDYGARIVVECKSCGHQWKFDPRTFNTEKALQEILETKPPRVGYH